MQLMAFAKRWLGNCSLFSTNELVWILRLSYREHEFALIRFSTNHGSEANAESACSICPKAESTVSARRVVRWENFSLFYVHPYT